VGECERKGVTGRAEDCGAVDKSMQGRWGKRGKTLWLLEGVVRRGMFLNLFSTFFLMVGISYIIFRALY
jgi:hypothetical protein